MSNFKYTAGLNNVGSYEVSGIPFASGSIDCRGAGGLRIVFPFVTRWVLVKNNSFVDSEDLRVGFSSNGVNAITGNNFFTLHDTTNNSQDRSSIMEPMELKITEIWLSGSRDVDVIAGLTNIPNERIDNISPDGLNWSGSHGGIG